LKALVRIRFFIKRVQERALPAWGRPVLIILYESCRS
jgi:hypothetical protein